MINSENRFGRAIATVRMQAVAFTQSFCFIACLFVHLNDAKRAQGQSPLMFRPLFFDDLEPFLGGSSPEASRPSNRYKTERIETERHDFTQSVETLGRGRVQLEFGYTYFYSDRDAEVEHAHTAPEIMVRVGLAEHIEFRLRSNYAWEFGEEHRDGGEDLRWSFKLGMSEYDANFKWRPESAMELRFTAPTAGGTFSTDGVEFGFDFIYGWPITERLELYGSSGYTTNGLGDFTLVGDLASEDAFNAWSQSLALGLELTECSTVYNEFFGIFSEGREDDLTLVFYNIGIDYYITDDFVVDVRSGLGLTEESEDFFVGMGGGIRF